MVERKKRRHRLKRREKKAGNKLTRFATDLKDALENEARSKRRRTSSRSKRRASHKRKRRIAVGMVALGLILSGGAVLSWIYYLQESASSQAYEQALQEFTRGDYQKSVEHLQEALRADRNDLSAQLLLGRSFLALGLTGEAVQKLRHALASGADYSLVLLPLAQALLQDGDYEALLTELPTDISQPRLHSKILFLQAQARTHLGQLGKAEHGLEIAADIDPTAADPHLGLAILALRRGQFEQATKAVRRAEVLEPQRAQVWYVKAEIARAHRNETDALAAVDRAVEIDPKHLDTRLLRATLRIDADHDEAATEDLAVVWQQQPDSPLAHYLHALILTKRNEPQLAAAKLDQAGAALVRYRTEYVLRHAPSLLVKAVSAIKKERFEEGAALLARHIEIEPYNTSVRKLSASILLMKSLPSRAIDTLTPALETSGGDAELLSLLSQAYQMRGDEGPSKLLLKRGLENQAANPAIRTTSALNRLALSRGGGDEFGLLTELALGETDEDPGILIGYLQLKRGQHSEAIATANTLIAQRSDYSAAFNLLGAAQLVTGKTKEARSNLEQALALDPGYVNAQLNLANLAGRVGQYEQARQIYLKLIESVPGDSRAFTGIASIAKEANAYQEAAAWMEKAVAVAPMQLSLQLRLADTYIKGGKFANAAEKLKALRKEHPRNLSVRIAMGRLELESGQKAGAVSTLRQLSEDVPDSTARLLGIADYQAAGGDLDGARATIDRAISLAPDDMAPRIASVRLGIAAGALEAALINARQVVKTAPEDPRAHQVLGEVLVQTQQYHQAASAYAEGLNVAPGSEELIAGLYEALWSAGNRMRAIDRLTAWTKRNPDRSRARRLLGDGLMTTGRFDEARDIYRTLVESFPADPAVLSNTALLFLASGEGEPIVLAQRAHRLAPDDANVLDALGWIMLNNGDAEGALKYLREAHSRDATNPRVRFHLGAALARLGRQGEARRELRSAVDSANSFHGQDEAHKLLLELGG